ncbi:MAG: glycosyltransferase [Thermodesulfobacteriota bacterium]
MRVFFIHPNFPAQFRHLAAALGRDEKNEVFFLTANRRPEWEIPGVRKVVYPKADFSGLGREEFVRAAVRHAEMVARSLAEVGRKAGAPDVLYAHSGWGAGLLVRDVFPKSILFGYFEWYYDSNGENARFDGEKKPNLGRVFDYRCRNMVIDQDLLHCHAGIVPTRWQKSQFPKSFQPKLKCLHDGVDISFFCPGEAQNTFSDAIGESEEIITYCARGLEPARGFPQFMRAAALVLRDRPKACAIVVGSDRTPYGEKPRQHRSFREQMLAELGAEAERIHFTGPLPYGKYRDILRLSNVHVYLTRPFVLSWSCLEAMSCGCLVVGSNTPPVREVLKDGGNGLLAEFSDPEDISAKINTALDYPSFMGSLRKNARQTILENYSLEKLLPVHLEMVQKAVSGKSNGPFG